MKIVIEVDGGVVRAVFAPFGSAVDVVVIVHENLLAEGKDYEAREAIIAEHCGGDMTQIA